MPTILPKRIRLPSLARKHYGPNNTVDFLGNTP